MKYLHGGLGAVLLFAIVIRVSAEILAPALPLIIVLFCVTSLLAYMVWPQRRL